MICAPTRVAPLVARSMRPRWMLLTEGSQDLDSGLEFEKRVQPVLHGRAMSPDFQDCIDCFCLRTCTLCGLLRSFSSSDQFSDMVRQPSTQGIYALLKLQLGDDVTSKSQYVARRSRWCLRGG